MGCGRPVINTWLDSAVRFVSIGGETGLTVAPQNVEQLASAMNLLLDDADLRTQFGRTARRRVETEFAADVMTERTLEVYEEVLGITRSSNEVYRGETQLEDSEVSVLD